MWDLICDADLMAAHALGLTEHQYALATSILTGALASGFLATWLFIFGRLRSAGIARRQQRLVWWFVITVTLLQIGIKMLQGDGIELLPCPWSALAVPFLTTIFACMAYGFHIEDGNKANGPTFFKLVVAPVAGDFVLTTKWVVGGLLKFLLSFHAVSALLA